MHDVERELTRVVDRLTSMPLTRAATATPAVERTAQILLDQTRPLDPSIPEDARLPHLQPAGLGAMIAVLGQEWLTAARTHEDADAAVVHDALVELRRALP
jgi:hypothetical protein